ncbi:MAG: AP2 domain-containing protein [Akkermansiaceae bacterium]
MSQAREDYALARIDLSGSSTHGWQVRLQRRGVKYAKYFGDRVYGGAESSLRAARGWRDELLIQISEAEQGEAVRVCTRSPRNRSGVVGVSKVTVTTNGADYQFWQATWSPQVGRRRTVKFSIMRYGERAAFQLAVEARKKGISQ